MRNIKLVLQYDGTRYQGWQKQENTDNTLQEKLEKLLGKMTSEVIELKGSGRTDKGVHAYGQVANFHTHSDKSLAEILSYMNFYLPNDIAVIHIEEVEERFHSRLWAVEKEYQYRIICSIVPRVFDYKYAYIIEDKLDVEAMCMAAKEVIGKYDFQAFTSAKKGKKSTVRTIYDIQIKQENEEILINYRGDGFLYHMVRLLTGTLIEIGNHTKNIEDMKVILDSRDRKNAGFLVPGNGLALMKVSHKS